jgi:hypothetical protein
MFELSSPIHAQLAQTTANIASNILLGVISGIVTSIAIFLFSVVWKKQLVPWYEQRVYKGIRIQGTWFLVDDDKDKPKDGHWTQIETLDISQTAHHIVGTLTLSPKEGVGGPVIALTVTGDITDRFVSMSFKSPSQNRLAYGVILGEVRSDGNRIEGQAAYYEVHANAVVAAEVIYERKT